MNYFNSDLADIGFQTFEPSKELEPYIYNYWIVRKQNLTKPILNKILSDGNSGIVINFSSAFITKINQNDFVCKKNFTYCGPTKYPLFMNFENRIDAIGIRFKPAGAFRFFDKDISSFKDIVIEIDNNDDFKIDDLYENLINTILENKGDVNIENLCEDFNINPRLCARKFKQEVGISAKLFARLTRIVNTKEIISSLKIDSLTTIAYDNGFFDQSHFTNEFKSFMDETPKDYFSKKYNMAKSLNFKQFSK